MGFLRSKEGRKGHIGSEGNVIYDSKEIVPNIFEILGQVVVTKDCTITLEFLKSLNKKKWFRTETSDNRTITEFLG